MPNKYLSKDLSHHGVIATICDQIGVTETVDEMIPPDSRAELSMGGLFK